MWDILLLGVFVLAIAAMVFLPTINTMGAQQESKCSSCPKKAARDAMASQ